VPRKQLGACSGAARRRGCWRSPAVPCRRCHLMRARGLARLACLRVRPGRPHRRSGRCALVPRSWPSGSARKASSGGCRLLPEGCSRSSGNGSLNAEMRGSTAARAVLLRGSVTCTSESCAAVCCCASVPACSIQMDMPSCMAKHVFSHTFATLVEAVDLDSLLLARVAPVVGHRSPA